MVSLRTALACLENNVRDVGDLAKIDLPVVLWL